MTTQHTTPQYPATDHPLHDATPLNKTNTQTNTPSNTPEAPRTTPTRPVSNRPASNRPTHDRPASSRPSSSRPASRFTPTAAPSEQSTPPDPLAEAARLLSSRDLNAKQLGVAGEHYAALWLECQDWRILSRNWRSRYGELDIVALAPNGEIVFVEVKTRRSVAQGVPQAAVDRRKQGNLRRAAMEWLLDGSNDVSHYGTRFDVIAILVTGFGPQVTHIPGAF